MVALFECPFGNEDAVAKNGPNWRACLRSAWRAVKRFWSKSERAALIVSSLLLWWQVWTLSGEVRRQFAPKYGLEQLFFEDFSGNLNDLYVARQRKGTTGLGWSPLSPQGRIETVALPDGHNWALKLTRDAESDSESVTGLGIPIDGEELRGKRIQLRAVVKADSIRRGKASFNTGQCNLYYDVRQGTSAPLKDVWEAVPGLEGTFDWKRVAAQADTAFKRSQTPCTTWLAIPTEASVDMHLVVSLQGCKGTMWLIGSKS